VPAPLPALLLVPLLLAGLPTASPAPSPCQTGVRHLELPMEPQDDAPQVCISPVQPTFIDFNETFEPGSVALEGEERFARVEPTHSSLKLVPSERLRPGERLRLTVRFPGTATPASATLLLVVHPALAEPLVHVHRQTRAADSYRQELVAAKEETRQCQQENARLRAEQGLPRGLVGLLASGLLGEEDTGVLAADITKRVQRLPSSALEVNRAQVYRTEGRVALRLKLTNPEGAAPWVAQGATLAPAGRQGEALKILNVWQPAPVPTGDAAMLVVEAEAPSRQAQGPFVLRLWAEGEARPVTLSGVMLP